MKTWYKISHFLSQWSPLIGVLIIAAYAMYQIRKRDRRQQKAKKTLEQAIATHASEPVSLHPVINPSLCLGCGACIRVCPEGTILQLVNHKAVLVSPTMCVGHGECEKACPFGAIDLVFGTKTRGMEIPRLTKNFETNMSGVYIAGELGGMGLIRNAVKQGTHAVAHAAKKLEKNIGKTDVDILIVGAGAAGLTATLGAHALKKRYICIEQNTVGGTIANFPRQKVVMTHPAHLPLVGEMKFPRHKVSKEELLEFWIGLQERHRLKIQEYCKFLSMEQDSSGLYRVNTSSGRITAQKIILAMGVRGTPRKLGVPGEESTKVTYNLLEPEQYQGMHVAVVGGGNAAAEAAIMLADPQLRIKVTLLVRSATMTHANFENQEKVARLINARVIRAYFDTVVSEIQPHHIIVSQAGKKLKIDNHFVFVYAGAEMPHAFLKGLGIKIDKKYGESSKAKR